MGDAPAADLPATPVSDDSEEEEVSSPQHKTLCFYFCRSDLRAKSSTATSVGKNIIKVEK